MDQSTILATLRRASDRIASLEAELARSAPRRDPVAIIGAALRFPGATDLASYAALLESGRDAVAEPPAGRFRGQPRAGAPHLLAGYLDEIARFDHALFEIAPDEARHMDPQQRHLLELAFAALLHAGIDPGTMEGARVGVYLGLAKNLYGERPGAPSPYSATGGLVATAAGRIAHQFGFRGPALVVDTACSSALAATHLAVRALRDGECDLALVGASNLILSGDGHAVFADLGLLAPDGRSRAFEARAEGFGRGEGAAVAVLRRAADAAAAGERVLALLEGSAMGHDGRAAGLTAPNGEAQAAVIRAALADAGRSAGEVAAVEAHGTGTRLGDAVEAEALEAVFAGRASPVAIGSAKAVVGHLEHAAGMASLLKAVLATTGTYPAQPDFTAPNPAVRWAAVAPAAAPVALETPVIGVSGFGISGTNVHVVVSAAPAPAASTAEATPFDGPLLLSAPSASALAAQAEALAAHLAAERPPLVAVARQLAVRRPHMRERAAMEAASPEEAAAGFAALAASISAGPAAGSSTALALGTFAGPRGRADRRARVAFVFAGQGGQFPAMGRALLETSPEFAAAIDRVAAALNPFTPAPLRTLLSDPAPFASAATAQPALFGMQVALASLWRAAGVEPALVVGHSVGEFAAAAIAGALSLEDAAFAVATRARIVAERAGGRGAMASVELGEDEAAQRLPAIGADLKVAVVNEARQLIVSGGPESVDRLVEILGAEGRFARRVDVDYASHSPFMEPLVGVIAAALAPIRPRAEAVPLLSSAAGDLLPGTAFDAAYFARALATPVRFADAVARAIADGTDLFVEVGPHPVLLPAIAAAASRADRPVHAVTTLTREQGDRRAFLSALAAAWTRGAAPDWSRVLPPAPFAELPLWRFGGEPLWLDPAPAADAAPPAFALQWKPLPAAPATAGTSDPWSVPDAPLATALRAAGLAADGAASRIVHLPDLTADDVGAALDAFAALVRTQPREVALVTRGATAAFGPPAGEAGAALLAFARAAAAEHPDIDIRAIDITGEVDAAALAAELASEPPRPGATVALRGRDRRGEVLTELTLPAAALDFAAGVHVVTGGLSGVGLETAAALAEGGATALALLARGAEPDATTPAGARIAALRAAGIRVTTHRADVADHTALAAALAEIRATHGRIASVSHAAGIGPRAAVAELDAAAIAAVLAPKLTGARHLAELTAGDDLSFVLLQGSVAPLLRSPLQSAYAAANAALGALAERLRAAGRPVTTVAWPVWRDVGLAARDGFSADTAFRAINPAEGRRRILDAARLTAARLAPPVLVAAEPNLEPAMAGVLRAAPFALSAELASRLPPLAPPAATGAGDAAGRPAGNYGATELALAAVYARILGHRPVDVFAPFFALGGNSILAARIANALKAEHPELGAEMVDVLASPTVAALAETLDRRHAGPAEAAIPAVAPAEHYAASFEQRRFWFQHVTAADKTLFNLTTAWRVEGVCAEALDRALVALVARHEPLRTTLEMGEDALLQVVHPAPDVVLRRIDLSGEADGDAAARAHCLAEARFAFDLARDLPFRAVLLSRALPGAGDVLCLTLHHIAGDGWGLGVFADELAETYAAERDGRMAALPPLPVTYKDYAAWQARRHAPVAVAAALEAWRQRLSPPLPAANLPTDRPRPPVRFGRGAKTSHRLDTATSVALDAAAAAAGLTPSMVFLALVAATMHRLGGDTDVVIGMPTAGRDHPDLERIVGNFLGTLPIRLHPGSTTSLADLAEEARRAVVDAFALPPVPFDALLDAVAAPRHPGRSPLFDVMLLFQNHREADVRIGAMTPFLKVVEHAKVDLTVEVRRDETGYEVALEVDTALFDPATVDRVARTLLAATKAFASDPSTPIGSDAAPLTGAALAARFAAPMPPVEERTILATIARQAADAPDAIALEACGTRLTYRELMDAAGRWAAAFAPLGVGARVGLAFGNDTRHVLALLGAWWAGAVPMPLDPAMPTPAREALLAFTDTAAVAQAPGASLGPVMIEAAGLTPDSSGPVPPINLDPEADAYIFPTSGSTGAPKAVVGRHGSLEHFIRWQGREFGIDRTVRTGFTVGFTFDASLRDILLPLAHGSTLVVPKPAERGDFGALAGFIARARLTVLHTVPSVLRPLTAEMAVLGTPTTLGHVFVSGEPLFGEDVRRWAAVSGASCRVVNFYGSTETTMIRTFHVATGNEDGAVPAGRPIADTRIALLVDGRHAEPGEPGEVVVRTGQATKGYLGRPDLTAAAFVPNPLTGGPEVVFRSGDVGVLDERGVLRITGRADRMVKVGGIRVDLGEVERVAAAVSSVIAAAVAAEDGMLVAHVVPRTGAADVAAAVRAAVRGALGDAAVPSRIAVVDRLPLLPSGKVDRRALAASDNRSACAVVARLFAEVVGRETVDPDTHLFDLGGSSLNAMTLVPRLNRALGLSLDFAAFMQRPTVNAVAAAAGEEPAAHAFAAVPRVPDAPFHAVSHAQRRMWLLHATDAAEATFNIKRAWDLTGPLDAGALGRAVAGLVHRNESLRTTFRLEGGDVVQVVHPAGPALAVEDISAAGDPDAEAAARVAQIVGTPFDLERGPLLRVVLLRLAPERHVLAVAVHHIVSDGWSMARFDRDLVELYNAALGVGAEPEPLPVQARDLAAWQNGRILGGEYNVALERWAGRLAGPLPRLDLPLDRPRPAARRSRGGHVTGRLPAPLAAALGALARDRGTTLFAGATAALAALLARLCRSEEVVLGTAVAGREAPEAEGAIGFFVNAVALRTPVRPDASFRDLIQSMGEIVAAALADAAVPFDAVVERLDLARDLSRTPVFDVAIQLLHEDFGGTAERPRPHGLTVRRFPLASRTAQYDLTLFLRDDGDGLFVIAEYNVDLFDRATVERWLGHLGHLLEAAVAAPDTPVADLPLLTAAEEAQIAAHESGPPAPAADTLTGLFARAAAAHPEVTAVVCRETCISYGDLAA